MTPKKTSTVIAAFMVTTLAGCATGPSNEKLKIDGFERQKYDFFANLVESGNGWKFEDISMSPHDREVNLYTFEYLGQTSNSGPYPDLDLCERGLLGFTPGNCRIGDVKFPGGDSNPLFYLAAPLTAATGPIKCFMDYFDGTDFYLDACVGTVLAFPVFNWRDYEKAIIEAQENDGFKRTFPQANAQYHDMTEKAEKIHKANAIYTSNAADMEEIQKIRTQERRDELQELFDGGQKFIVDDYSGFLTEHARQRIKESLAKGIQRRSVLEIEEARYSSRALRSLKNPDAVFTQMPSFSDAREFKHFVDLIPKKINDIQKSNALTRQQIELENDRNKEKLENYTRKLSDSGIAVNLNLNHGANDDLLHSYNSEIFIPESSAVDANGDIYGNEVKAVIESINIDYIFSPRHIFSDDFISVDIYDEKIIIENKTDRFVTLDTISLYYRDEILSKSGDEFKNLTLLPPKSRKISSLWWLDTQVNGFPKSSLPSLHSKLTQTEAQNETLRYGLALKYRISGESTDRTIQRVEDYSLIELIENEGVEQILSRSRS